jgi:hypothetical protein
MIRLSRTAAALAVASVFFVVPLAAQEPLPPGLAEVILRRVGDEYQDAADLARDVAVERVDLNGDGRAEALVTSQGRTCGASGNCMRAVYQETPGGGWRELYNTGAQWLRPLESTTNGWPDLGDAAHFSAFEAYHMTAAFDGERYVWSSTELLAVGPGAAPEDTMTVRFRVWSPVPPRGSGPPAPRRVTLDETPSGAAVAMSAAYDACPRARATPGRLCGQPRLVLRAEGTPAPWGAGACFTLSATADFDVAAAPVGGALCPVEGSGGGRVVLAPTPAQWDALYRAVDASLRAGSFTLTLSEHAHSALYHFVYALYELNGVPTTLEDDG